LTLILLIEKDATFRLWRHVIANLIGKHVPNFIRICLVL